MNPIHHYDLTFAKEKSGKFILFPLLVLVSGPRSCVRGLAEPQKVKLPTLHIEELKPILRCDVNIWQLCHKIVFFPLLTVVNDF